MFTDFYTIETVGEKGGEYTCKIRLNPGHAVYKGHFPGMPVVPGVCMLRVIKECVSMALNVRVRYGVIGNCKFLSVVNPMEREWLTLVFSLKNQDSLQAVVSADEVVALKLKAALIIE